MLLEVFYIENKDTLIYKVIAPGTACGVLDSKLKSMNGVICSEDKASKKSEENAGSGNINTGTFKL